MNNRSLQSWSPRTRPLEYDSLQQDSGCQATSGATVFLTKPFARICIFEHDAASDIFNQSNKASYTMGPQAFGGAMPWVATWAVWVAVAGLRFGKLSSVTPPSVSLGSEVPFYDTISPLPSKVAIGFTSKGFLAVAIQKTQQGAEVKWFADGNGNVATAAFPGTSPVLFNNGILQLGNIAGATDLVLFYLRSEEPRSIFARFEREAFLTEHVINGDLQVDLARLISTGAHGNKQVLYAADAFGRDVTLYSAEYIPLAQGDKGLLALVISSGSYRQVSVPASTPVDSGRLLVSIFSGAYSDPVQEPDVDSSALLSADQSLLSIGITSGEYL